MSFGHRSELFRFFNALFNLNNSQLFFLQPMRLNYSSMYTHLIERSSERVVGQFIFYGFFHHFITEPF